MQAITLNEAPQDLLSVINRVNNDHEPLVITGKSHKSVVIMSLDDFNVWQETVDFTPSSSGRRKPSAKIAGKGDILGDII
jgi:antitoxin YefM